MKFLRLSLLAAQNKQLSIRRNFSKDPLSAIVANPSRLIKIQPIFDLLIHSIQSVYYPSKQLSLHESLLLQSGYLVFRQYIPNKKSKYDIKFYELCIPDGYILNFEVYCGQKVETKTGIDPKTNQLMK